MLTLLDQQLFALCEGGFADAQAVERLLSRGANVFALNWVRGYLPRRPQTKATPLHLACQTGLAAVVALLLA